MVTWVGLSDMSHRSIWRGGRKECVLSVEGKVWTPAGLFRRPGIEVVDLASWVSGAAGGAVWWSADKSRCKRFRYGDRLGGEREARLLGFVALDDQRDAPVHVDDVDEGESEEDDDEARQDGDSLPEQWSAKQLASWLESLRLHSLAVLVRQEDLRGSCLFEEEDGQPVLVSRAVRAYDRLLLIAAVAHLLSGKAALPAFHRVLQWSVGDVERWLKNEATLAEHAPLFTRAEVDGRILAHLTPSVAFKHLHFDNPRARMVLFRSLSSLLGSSL